MQAIWHHTNRMLLREVAPSGKFTEADKKKLASLVSCRTFFIVLLAFVCNIEWNTVYYLGKNSWS